MEKSLHEQWGDALFGIRRSVRYHARRCAFFDTLDKASSAAGVIFGSAAIYSVTSKSPEWVSISAAVVTALSTANLVIGSVSKARDHADFVRQFTDLERRMLSTPQTEAALRAINDDRLLIELNEPRPLRVLDMLCHNELVIAQGRDKKYLAKVGPLQRLCAPFFDLGYESIAAAYLSAVSQ